MLEWAGQDFKVAIIKVLQQAIKNSLEINETIGYLSKETEVVKNENFKLENIIKEIIHWIGSVEMTKDITNEL